MAEHRQIVLGSPDCDSTEGQWDGSSVALYRTPLQRAVRLWGLCPEGCSGLSQAQKHCSAAKTMGKRVSPDLPLLATCGWCVQCCLGLSLWKDITEVFSSLNKLKKKNQTKLTKTKVYFVSCYAFILNVLDFLLKKNAITDNECIWIFSV